MAVISLGITSRCNSIPFFLSLKGAKKPFPEAPYQTSLCHWLKLVEVINPTSVIVEDNGTMVIYDQDLPLDRASFFFLRERDMDTDTFRTLLERKKEH